jgi:hypothetical protein
MDEVFHNIEEVDVDLRDSRSRTRSPLRQSPAAGPRVCAARRNVGRTGKIEFVGNLRRIGRREVRLPKPTGMDEG